MLLEPCGLFRGELSHSRGGVEQLPRVITVGHHASPPSSSDGPIESKLSTTLMPSSVIGPPVCWRLPESAGEKSIANRSTGKLGRGVVADSPPTVALGSRARTNRGRHAGTSARGTSHPLTRSR